VRVAVFYLSVASTLFASKNQSTLLDVSSQDTTRENTTSPTVDCLTDRQMWSIHDETRQNVTSADKVGQDATRRRSQRRSKNTFLIYVTFSVFLPAASHAAQRDGI